MPRGSYEQTFLPKYDFVIGVDEAGRGPLCGPVTTAAFCWYDYGTIQDYDWTGKINDSKQIKEDDREKLYDSIKDSSIDKKYSFDLYDCGADEIDRINILAATLESMKKAVYKVMTRIIDDHKDMCNIKMKVLVDGDKVPPGLEYMRGSSLFALPVQIQAVTVSAIIKGDAKVFSIGAASIVAKAHRDRVMRRYAVEYKGYDLETNKGYGTEFHRKAIAHIGPSFIHRLSFEPCYSCIATGTFSVPSGRNWLDVENLKTVTTVKENKRQPNQKVKKLPLKTRKPLPNKSHSGLANNKKNLRTKVNRY
ncbi:ribonuclease HII [Gregarina niphandrodes]|uniref:Ribonuclease n=1 Tax=Gregarina niphandrodes TaxID=110365 RepID=A0A023B0G7_GRENI|nr:ribonuclease HII [Gregarina niphandrodes]EZG44925.1 ribonuclease HII [Gregarina niphandrodes]|eukprot:XP_011132624.1 ribonuclease HII [Gregarina niphandrodes]